MKITKALSYDDVLIVPQKSDVLPKDTDISTRLTRRIALAIPLVSAPMDTVTEHELAIAMGKEGGMGIIHKNMPVAEQVRHVERVKAERIRVGAAISVGDDQFERAVQLKEAGVDVLVVDTAHGHSEGVLAMVARLRTDSRFRFIDIIAGNVATASGAYDLILAGADAVKVGVGPGSICTTRIVTGIGVPQFSAIQEAVKGRKRSKKNTLPIIADGGIKYSGDIAKAIAAGASCVMVGGLLAGTKEAPGETVTHNGVTYKTYRGMGSLEAMEKGSKDRYAQQKVEKKKLVPEGVSGLVPYRGTVASQTAQLMGGLRSAMGYVGSRTIREFQKRAQCVEVSPLGLKESHPHSLHHIESTINYETARE